MTKEIIQKAEELLQKADYFGDGIVFNGLPFGEIKTVVSNLLELVDIYQDRLEIKHVYNHKGEQEEIPVEERDDHIDGISCRDETIRQLEDTVEGQGWQPIETAPVNEDVLLYSPHLCASNKERIELGHAASRWGAGRMSKHAWATHWMPLPKLPDEAPEERAEREKKEKKDEDERIKREKGEKKRP